MDARDVVLQLPPDVSSIALARAHVWAQTEGFTEDLRDDAQLLVSELVTNAIQHGSAEITMRITHEAGAITVRVDDSGPDLPAPNSEVPDGASSGRGLRIVDALAHQWGIQPREHSPGKTVWFRYLAAEDHDRHRDLVQ